jgi:hypothetical protein
MKPNTAEVYTELPPGSLPVRVATYQRRKMFERFLQRFDLPDPEMTLLDVGVTSDRALESSNYLEAWYPLKDRITAVGIDNAQFLELVYPGMRFLQANALDLPLDDRSYDVVHSSAVIEHVGCFDNQVRMIAECARVARRGLFLTTPNRWFPVEFHTVLPLVHWLPKATFRSLLRAIGKDFFAEEANLNLMSRSELLRAAEAAAGSDFAFTVEAERLGGWPANLLLVGHRRSAKEPAEAARPTNQVNS